MRCTKKAKENWIGEECSEIEDNLGKNNSKRAYQLVKDLTIVKQGKATTVRDRSGKCLTEERQILNRWTEYCSELYTYKASGDPSVLNCPQTDTEDDYPLLRREVEAAVQPLKKEMSAGVDNIPAELVQAGGEDVITALTTMRNTVWQTGECIISRVFNDLAPSTAHFRIFLDVTNFCCYCCRFCSFFFFFGLFFVLFLFLLVLLFAWF